MSWKKIAIFAPSCDECGWNFWGDVEAAPTFETPMVGRLELAEKYEWRLERTLDGITMLCPDCASKHDCETLGHEWAPPVVDQTDPTADLLPDHCIRCTLIRRTDRPAEGHPESMELGDIDQDADLFTRLEADISQETT